MGQRQIRNNPAIDVERTGTSIRQAALVEDGLLSIAAASQFYNISRSKLYELMDVGELAYVKLGRARRIPKRALVECAARHLRGGWNGSDN